MAIIEQRIDLREKVMKTIDQFKSLEIHNLSPHLKSLIKSLENSYSKLPNLQSNDNETEKAKNLRSLYKFYTKSQSLQGHYLSFDEFEDTRS